MCIYTCTHVHGPNNPVTFQTHLRTHFWSAPACWRASSSSLPPGAGRQRAARGGGRTGRREGWEWGRGLARNFLPLSSPGQGDAGGRAGAPGAPGFSKIDPRWRLAPPLLGDRSPPPSVHILLLQYHPPLPSSPSPPQPRPLVLGVADAAGARPRPPRRNWLWIWHCASATETEAGSDLGSQVALDVEEKQENRAISSWLTAPGRGPGAALGLSANSK